MTALPASGTFAMVDPEHVAAVGPAAAILFARLTWRAQKTGEWRATRSEIAAETGLSLAMIRTAVEVLRRHQWIETRRTSTLDSTLIWTPILPGQPERLDPQSRDSGSSTPPLAESAIPSYETDRDNPPSSPPWTPEDPPVDAGRTPPWTGGEPSVEPSVEPSGASDGLFDPPAVPKAPRRKPKRPYPDDFRPTEAHRAKARELGVDLAVEGPKFRDYHLAHDSRHADWSAALHLWIRNAAEFARRRGDNVTLLHGRNVHTDTTYDPAYEATLPPPVTEPRAWSVR